jgi:hypothetical protein
MTPLAAAIVPAMRLIAIGIRAAGCWTTRRVVMSHVRHEVS